MAQGSVDTGYKPRALQDYLHRSFKRFNVIVCHRRFGKTVCVLNDMIDRGLFNNLKNPQYAYLAPTYGQAKRVAWDYLKDIVKNLPNIAINEAELRIDILREDRGDKIRFVLLGAENPGSLRGLYLDGVILDEFAEMTPDIWGQVIRPALSDRTGWAIFIGTPKGMNHFYDVYQMAENKHDWFRAVYRASDTGIIPLVELEAARQVMSDEEYNQEYECSFSAALVGAYFGKEIEEAEKQKRITEVPYDKALLVHTFWDLGIGDSTAIWFAQFHGGSYRCIDYLEDSGRGLDYYAAALKDRDYLYGEHTLPHDAEARDIGSGKSRVEILASLGVKVSVLPRTPKKDDMIQAARVAIAKCYFDTKKCERGVHALRNYQRKWDAKNKIFSSAPKHDWSSHGSDAFQILAMSAKDEYDENLVKELPRHYEMAYDIFGDDK